MNRRSITFRLIFGYCSLLLLLGVVFSLFTIASFQYYARETMQTAVSSRANDVWNMIQDSLNNPAQLAALIERRFDPAMQDRFIRVSRNSKILYQSGAPAHHGFDPAAIPPFRGDGASGMVQYGILSVYTRRIPIPAGSIVIESGQTNVIVHSLQSGLVRFLIVGLSALLAVAAIGGYILIRRTLAPVELMITAAEAITFNNPRNRLPLLGTADRIDALGVALNRMLDRLDNAYRHASRFSTDAAHELRTPLTIIRAELEFTLAHRAVAPDVKDALQDILDEVARLGNMVDNLLILSRMESLWGKRAHSDVDLVALASEAVDQIQFIAEEKQVRMQKPSGGPVVVAGDRDRLKQVLVNLLDNGIKYNKPGGIVSVGVGTAEDQAMITVADTGIGIAPSSQEYIFDRFYRVSTDRGEIGVGLGLAIVRSICHAHGGTVEVQSDVGKGSVFSIKLPLTLPRTIAMSM